MRKDNLMAHITGAKKKLLNMKNNIPEELVIKLREIKQDLIVLENKKKRINWERNQLILKLVAQREQLLAHKEQDE